MYRPWASDSKPGPSPPAEADTLEHRIRTILEERDRFPARFAAVDEPTPMPAIRSLGELLRVGRPAPVSEQLAAFVKGHSDAFSLAVLCPFCGGRWERSALILGLGLEPKYWPLMRKLGWPPGVTEKEKAQFDAEFAQECTRMVIDGLARTATPDPCGHLAPP